MKVSGGALAEAAMSRMSVYLVSLVITLTWVVLKRPSLLKQLMNLTEIEHFVEKLGALMSEANVRLFCSNSLLSVKDSQKIVNSTLHALAILLCTFNFEHIIKVYFVFVKIYRHSLAFNLDISNSIYGCFDINLTLSNHYPKFLGHNEYTLKFKVNVFTRHA